MTIQVDAIYEHGAFRPAHPVKLEEGTQVVLTIETERTGNGFNVTPSETGSGVQSDTATLSREGSLLVLCGSAPLNIDDVNQAIDIARNERHIRIADLQIEPQ